MYTCANCRVVACTKGIREALPKNCPMKEAERMGEMLEAYSEAENKEFYIKSTAVEGKGYCQWPRVRETLEFCRDMGYRKIGIAFCKGLHREAEVVANLFRKEGFDVVSVICKTGGYPKEAVGVPAGAKINPDNQEIMCNPIAQAMLLNRQHTEFNIEIGLCVGHDSMFYKYSDAMVTTLVAKDRVLAHNPCGAIYCADGYFKQKLTLEEER